VQGLGTESASGRRRPPGLPLRVFAILTTIGLFLVVVLGFIDTATNSALGCGRSFPLCHGSLFPGDNIKAIIEWSHRALAAIVGLLEGAMVVWAWVRAWQVIEVRVLGAIGLGFVVVESVVGAMAVLSPESEAVIAVHLGIALTAFAATALLTQALWSLDETGVLRRPTAPAALRRWVWLMLAFMYVAVYVGAYVAGTNSGIACLTWPLCPLGQVTASLGNPVTVDLIHRTVALVGAVFATGLFLTAQRAQTVRPDLARLARWVLILIGLQIASGLLLVLTHIAIETSILHVALATVLFTVVAAMAMGILPESPAARAPGKGKIRPEMR
jgi:cytochrome c oxidase assembly protein subunit 15